MDKITSDQVEARLRSRFVEGAIARVQLLSYGDDPGVEPGEAAVRVFIDRAGRPVGRDEDKQVMEGFEPHIREASQDVLDGLPPFGWVEFRPDNASEDSCGRVPMTRLSGRREPPRLAEEVGGEQLTPVMTRLGRDDLATVDTLITAGIASSRADALRWALGRIREHAVYSQLQQRVREIEELKSQF
jgi:hypothetical protein